MANPGLSKVLSRLNKNIDKSRGDIASTLDESDREFFNLKQKFTDRLENLNVEKDTELTGASEKIHNILKDIIEKSQNATLSDLKTQAARLQNLQKVIETDAATFDINTLEHLNAQMQDSKQVITGQLQQKQSILGRIGGAIKEKAGAIGAAGIAGAITGNNPFALLIGSLVDKSIQLHKEQKKEAIEASRNDSENVLNEKLRDRRSTRERMKAGEYSNVPESFASGTGLSEAQPLYNRIEEGAEGEQPSIFGRTTETVVKLLEDIKTILKDGLQIEKREEIENAENTKESLLAEEAGKKGDTITNALGRGEKGGLLGILKNLGKGKLMGQIAGKLGLGGPAAAGVAEAAAPVAAAEGISALGAAGIGAGGLAAGAGGAAALGGTGLLASIGSTLSGAVGAVGSGLGSAGGFMAANPLLLPLAGVGIAGAAAINGTFKTLNQKYDIREGEDKRLSDVHRGAAQKKNDVSIYQDRVDKINKSLAEPGVPARAKAGLEAQRDQYQQEANKAKVSALAIDITAYKEEFQRQLEIVNNDSWFGGPSSSEREQAAQSALNLKKILHAKIAEVVNIGSPKQKVVYQNYLREIDHTVIKGISKEQEAKAMGKQVEGAAPGAVPGATPTASATPAPTPTPPAPGTAEAPRERIPSTPTPAPAPAPTPAPENLGDAVKKFESGKSGAGTVSTGKGDAGGASYGTYQLSSKAGTLGKFLDKSGYGSQFAGLQPGSAEFNAKWKEVAKNDPKFASSQHDFIKETHYDVQAAKLQKAGIDVSKLGPKAQEAVWSTSVQYGPNTGVIEKALAGKNVNNQDEFVNALQDYKAANVEKNFASSSPEVRNSVAGRIQNERQTLLAMDSKPTAKVQMAENIPIKSGAALHQQSVSNSMARTSSKSVGSAPPTVNGGGHPGPNPGAASTPQVEQPRTQEPIVQALMINNLTSSKG